MTKQKRVAAIHDISCFGKCSLTVALPILSAAGVETSVIPTAVLSTHTGGFTGFTYRDLTDDLLPVASHWKTLGLQFDALYSGFLGSFEQIEIIKQIFDMWKLSEVMILVDPVMADNGKLYDIFPDTFPAGMASLCTKADVIIPNITEACLMLGETYTDGPYTRKYIENLMEKLATLGPKKIVLTGVCFEKNRLGAGCYDATTDMFHFTMADRVEGYFHGTGDVFGSALLAGLMNGFDLATSTGIAVSFTAQAISRTYENGTDLRYGVDFEESIPQFLKLLNIFD